MMEKFMKKEEQGSAGFIENLTPDFTSIPGLLEFLNKDGPVMSRAEALRQALSQ